MAPALKDLLATDDLSILLALVGATLFLLKNLYKPQPLVHPILLGRQSDAARVRNPKESAVYRNYGTGILGRFPVRPDKDINLLEHIVRSDVENIHSSWTSKVTNPQLKERAKAFGNGLIRAGLVPHESNVLFLLKDSIEFIIADLALAAHSIVSFTISSNEILDPVLDSHPPSAIFVDAEFLPQLLELLLDSNEQHTIVVAGEVKALPKHKSAKINILYWNDVEKNGATEVVSTPASAANEVFSVAFFPSESGKIQGTTITHENMTAGVAAIRALVPPSNAISPLDTIVSMFPLTFPYGRAIAYTALYEGCNFTTLGESSENKDNSVARLQRAISADLFPIPPATLLFTDPTHLAALVTPILKKARESYLFPFAWRHKLSGMFDGFLTKDSLWDRLVLDQARAEVMKEAAGTLRTVIIGGGPQDIQAVIPARIALSIPIVNTYVHRAVTSPVLASHALDLQVFPEDTSTGPAHVGPPVVNLEVKLVGIDEDALEKGSDPVGSLLARGPPVGKLLDVSEKEGQSAADDEGWVKVAEKAVIQTNGSFKVLVA